MIFVDRLCIVHWPEQIGKVKLCDTNRELKDEKNIDHQSNFSMSTLKACFWMGSFVHFNNHQTRNQQANRDEVERWVYVCALDFLLLSGSRLQEKDRLNEENNAGRVEELHRQH